MTKIDLQLQKIIQFLETIGIQVIEKDLDDTTFLPGLSLGPDTVYVDYSKLKYPGDLLHEAGHIAVTSPEERKLAGSDKMAEGWPSQGDEIAAILWSYAAALHLKLPPEFVFHEHGYKGNSQWFIDNFTAGNYMGLPLLQWYTMAPSTEKVVSGMPAFPAMQHWMRP